MSVGPVASGWSGSTRRSRLPVDWPARRHAVMQRDHWQCRIRGPQCVVLAAEVDHINRGDDHDTVNLRAVCVPCHRAKTAAEGNSAKPRRVRPITKHPGEA